MAKKPKKHECHFRSILYHSRPSRGSGHHDSAELSLCFGCGRLKVEATEYTGDYRNPLRYGAWTYAPEADNAK